MIAKMCESCLSNAIMHMYTSILLYTSKQSMFHTCLRYLASLQEPGNEASILNSKTVHVLISDDPIIPLSAPGTLRVRGWRPSPCLPSDAQRTTSPPANPACDRRTPPPGRPHPLLTAAWSGRRPASHWRRGRGGESIMVGKGISQRTH